jgi:hypothetical protein
MRMLCLCFLALTAGASILYAQPPCPISGQTSIVVQIRTDGYGYETGWEVRGASGTLYFNLPFGTYANNTLYQRQVCVPSDDCITIRIFDSYGDGIFAPGYFVIFANTDTLASGRDFGTQAIVHSNCQPGEVCTTAATVEANTSYWATFEDTWYAFTPDSTGIYRISTCDSNACDTKIWIYNTCQGITLGETNEGTIFYDDDEKGCDTLASVRGHFQGGLTYYIRIGDDHNACADSIYWSLEYQGPVIGCMDPTSCNFNPLATMDDGSCIPQGNPDCPPGPDLVMREDVLQNSIYLTTINSTDACLIQEGCLRGFGQRDIIRFTTYIANEGFRDYFIGQPSVSNTQFTWDNCHNHFHYAGYAEYLLFDQNGAVTPAGFKNGFCVLDLGCTTGSPQFSCGNMGISAGCHDVYSSGLACQWIDVTDIPDGRYTFVTRVNWGNAPDALGQLEMDTLNNWAQVCIILSRATGALQMSIDSDCPNYTDCNGTPYGAMQPDCTGTCGGSVLRGDLDQDGEQEIQDAQDYVSQILGNDIEPTPCNDLNADGQISVYDAALLSSCLNFGRSHPHIGQGVHDHCNFPGGADNTLDTVTLSILQANFESNYIDIGIRNPATFVTAYQFKMSGIRIQHVENLVNPSVFPIAPRNNITEGMVIGISYQDSAITKSNIVQPLCRIYYSEIDPGLVCIDRVVDIVDRNAHRTSHRIEDGCVDYQISGTFNTLQSLSVSIQPNPFDQSTLLRFANPQGQDYNLEIRDIQGRLMRAWSKINSGTHLIERNDLPAGIYFYRLFGANGQALGRMVIR